MAMLTADRKAKGAKPPAKRVKARSASLNQIEKREPVKMGRPLGSYSYDDDIGRRICELVAQRIPVVEICAMEGMPDKSTLYRWKREIPTFSDDYARAREYRADARQDYIDEIALEAKNGKLDPHVARLIIDTEKWQMGKERPKAYGDKVALTDADGGKLVIEFSQ